MTPSAAAPNDRTLSVVLPVDLAAATSATAGDASRHKSALVTNSAVVEATEVRISTRTLIDCELASCLEQIKS